MENSSALKAQLLSYKKAINEIKGKLEELRQLIFHLDQETLYPEDTRYRDENDHIGR